jgi:hypothetical protein
MDTDGNDCFEFQMGATVRFKLTYQVLKDMPRLTAYVALRSGMTNEIVTSSRHILSQEPVVSGTVGTVVIEFADIFIRPGEYPLYFGMDDFSQRFDVVDDLTLPLVVRAGVEQQQDANFTPITVQGYFSLPARLLLNSRDQQEIQNV